MLATTEPAWPFSTTLAETGHAIRIVTLHRPPGAAGTELTYEVPNGAIYMKVQLSPGREQIFGRSFHWSERS